MPGPAASDDAVQQVRSRLNLLDTVRHRVQLRRAGREWVGLCPFHQEKTPSFSVNEAKQSWYCHGCGSGGDLFTFVERMEKVDFRGALELLADQAGVQLAERTPADRARTELRHRIVELNGLAVQYYSWLLWEHRAGEPGRDLLARRQVGSETARRFGLGFAPGGSSLAAYLRRKHAAAATLQAAGLVRRDGQDFFQNRLVIPIRDERGQTVAFTARAVATDDPRKYVNTPETPAYVKARVLFGLDLARPAIDESGHAVVMEGQFDVIVAHQFGVGNAVASSGTALTDEQVRLLRRHTDELLLMFDNDSAGRRATERAIELAAAEGLRTRVGRIEGEVKDPDEFLRSGGRWEDVASAARPGWEHLIRTAIEGLNPRRPADVEQGVRRIGAVLARVPEPAVRASYRDQAGLWFGIDPLLISLPRAPTRRGVQTGAAGPRLDEAGPEPSPAPRPAGGSLSRLVAYLLQVLAVRPDAAAVIQTSLPPAELQEDDRAALARLLATLERGAEALPQEVAGFPAEEERLVREAWAAPAARFAGEDVEELVNRIRARSRHDRKFAIIGRLSEAESRGDRAASTALEREWRSEMGRDGVGN
ncbi:MAG: DNA primase [Candidatus Dormibacteraeota bacterium]|nr:DNA primase [Candidatus Dormibacteraeota bacterium]